MLEIRVLGPLEVVADGAPLVVDTRKALAILALLAVEGRPFARDELAAMLWPESDDESARGALRRTLSVLRTALGDRWLAVDRASVALEAGAWIDLAVVEAATNTPEVGALSAAAALARGPFLAGFTLRDSVDFDEWRATRASAVERTVAQLLDRLADAAAAAGDLAAADRATARRVELDPLDEAAHRRRMTLLALVGDRAGAIRQYRTCVALLERELGVPPLAETTDLYDAIRDGRVAAMAPTPPVPSDAVAERPIGPRFRLPLVGREAELARVLTLVGPAGGSPFASRRLVAITGEAGIGKSRLVEAVAVAAEAKGSAVVVARAYASETGIAYGTIVELLRAGLARPDGVERLRTLPGPALAELARLVDLPAALNAPVRSDAEQHDRDPAVQTRLLGAIATALTALVAGAAGGPAGLLVVEDLHWADAASREALGWLARRLDGRPLVVVLTWRPEDLDELGAAFVASLEPMVIEALALHRLDGDDVARLVEAAATAGLQPPGAVALLEASEGLPLFVAEALMGGADAASRGVRALLRERLASVGETATQVLAAAAVLGRSFDLATVRGVSGRSEDETVAAIEELERRGLVRTVPAAGRPTTWDFAHARLREAAYDATSLARRQILHRRAADLVRSDPAAATDPAGLVQLAGHELAAGRGAEAAVAFAEAGLRARALHANREAEAHLEAAIALGHPDASRLQLVLGETRTALGDYRGAVAALEAAAAVLPAMEQPGVEVRLGRAHARRGDLATARSHLDAALDALEALGGGPDSDPILARALAERAAVAQRAHDGDGAVASATRALAMARALPDPAVEAAAHRVIGLAARDRGDLVGARESIERSLALATADLDDGATIAARNALALVLAASGDRDEALELLEDALAACRRTGERHLEAAVENNLADVLHAAGRPDDAMGHLKRAVALFAEVGGRPGELEPELWMLEAW